MLLTDTFNMLHEEERKDRVDAIPTGIVLDIIVVKLAWANSWSYGSVDSCFDVGLAVFEQPVNEDVFVKRCSRIRDLFLFQNSGLR